MAFDMAAPVMFLHLALLVASVLGYYSDHDKYISISDDFRRRPNGQVYKHPPLIGKMTKESVSSVKSYKNLSS